MKPKPKPKRKPNSLRLFGALATALLALPAGCYFGGQLPEQPTAASAPALNSDRIRQRFGSYGIKILRQDAQLRVSNLYSIHTDRSVCRTFAVVQFAQPIPGELTAAHAAIIAGGSVGEVLRQQGWQVKKQRLALTALDAVPQSEAGRLMGIAQPTKLATDVYQLVAQRGAQTLAYALIAEVHHPDYLDILSLQSVDIPSAADVSGSDDMLRLANQFLTQAPPMMH